MATSNKFTVVDTKVSKAGGLRYLAVEPRPVFRGRQMNISLDDKVSTVTGQVFDFTLEYDTRKISWAGELNTSAPLTRHSGYITKGTTITLDHDIALQEDANMDIPKDERFEDSKANRTKHQKEAAAIRKMMDLMLGFDNVEDAIALLGKTMNVGISSDLDAINEALANIERLRPFQDAVKGLDAAAVKRVHRHVAHAFDIPKGRTTLR